MFDPEKKRHIQGITVGELTKMLGELNPSAKVCIIGDNHFWLHVEQDGGTVVLDAEELDDCYRQFETCCVCGSKLEWEGTHPEKGVVWGCDNCMMYFCQHCFEQKVGSKEYDDMTSGDSCEPILCPECYKERYRR